MAASGTKNFRTKDTQECVDPDQPGEILSFVVSLQSSSRSVVRGYQV